MPSTRDLDGPDIDNLKRLMQSLAVLDAILSPDWEFRYCQSFWGRLRRLGIRYERDGVESAT